MEEVSEEVKSECGSKCHGLVCMLPPGHSGAILHAAVAEDGLHEWSVGDEAIVPVDAPKEGYWNGYWWGDIEKIRQNPRPGHEQFKGQEWRPSADTKEWIEYRGTLIFGKHSDEWQKNWAPEPNFRANYNLRRETEDDYQWHGYTLKDIKEACTRYMEFTKVGLSPVTGEKWYIEKGDIWATRATYNGGKPYRPYGSNESFIRDATSYGFLKKGT
jgi:hypothetical protein